MKIGDERSPPQGPTRGKAGQVRFSGNPVIEAAAGRPSGRRHNLACRGVGAAAPTINPKEPDFHRKSFDTNYDALRGSAPAATASPDREWTVLPVRNRGEIFPFR